HRFAGVLGHEHQVDVMVAINVERRYVQAACIDGFDVKGGAPTGTKVNVYPVQAPLRTVAAVECDCVIRPTVSIEVCQSGGAVQKGHRHRGLCLNTSGSGGTNDEKLDPVTKWNEHSLLKA